jgi:hypothetical protein
MILRAGSTPIGLRAQAYAATSYFLSRGNRCRPRAGANESCAESLRILSIMKEPIRDNKSTTNGVYAVQKMVSMIIVSCSRFFGR